VLLPIGLVLAWRDPRLPLRRGGLALAAGFLLGSLPVWLFEAARAVPDASVELFRADLGLSMNRLGEEMTIVLPALLGSYYWPVEGAGRQVAFALNAALYAAATALAIAGLARRGWRSGAPSDARWGVPLLLLILVTPFGMLYVSDFARTFDRESSRYVLLAYIPLLAFVAALAVRAWRWWRPAGVAVLSVLLAVDVWTNLGFMAPRLPPTERLRRREIIAVRAEISRYLVTHPVDALYVDDQVDSLRWAFLLPGVRVSELTTELYVPNAVAADAADRVAILSRHDPGGLEEQLRALGATYRTRPFGGSVLFEDIRVEPVAYRAVPREGWRVVGRAAVPPEVADGDLASAWPSKAGAPITPSETIVDLGALYAVGRVVWWPSTLWEHTHSHAVATSVDGVAWQPVGVQPDLARRPGFVAGGRPSFRPRNGWLEVRPPARPTRYLRFAPVDPEVRGGWAIAELHVYEATAGDPGPRPDTAALVTALRERGLRRLLADPAVSAGVARAAPDIKTRIANGMLDSHGAALPPAGLTAFVRVWPSDGLLVATEDVAELRRRLGAQGFAYTAEPLAGQVLFHSLATFPPLPCRRTAWHLVAGESGPEAAVIEARLQEPQLVLGLRLTHPTVSVRDVPLPEVAVSEDSRTWRPVPVRRVSEWVWAGRVLIPFVGQAEMLWLPPSPAQVLRIRLRRPSGPDPFVTSVCASGQPR
jgi:hypothetical protein